MHIVGLETIPTSQIFALEKVVSHREKCLLLCTSSSSVIQNVTTIFDFVTFLFVESIIWGQHLRHLQLPVHLYAWETETSWECRTPNDGEIRNLAQSLSPGSLSHTPATHPPDPPMHAYNNPAFHPAFVSRIPKPAPLHPPHKPGDLEQAPAQPQHGRRSPLLPLKQSLHSLRDPKQLPGDSHYSHRDPKQTPWAAHHSARDPLEELPSTSQMQPAVPAVLQVPSLPLRLDTTQQNRGQEAAQHQQSIAEHPCDGKQQQHIVSSHLFHQPGHEVVSFVSEDTESSSQQQEHGTGASQADGAGQNGVCALHAGPDDSKILSCEGREGNPEGAHSDEPGFGDMCRRLVAVTEVQCFHIFSSLSSSSPSSCSSFLLNVLVLSILLFFIFLSLLLLLLQILV